MKNTGLQFKVDEALKRDWDEKIPAETKELIGELVAEIKQLESNESDADDLQEEIDNLETEIEELKSRRVDEFLKANKLSDLDSQMKLEHFMQIIGRYSVDQILTALP